MIRTYYKLVSDDVIVDAICAEEANWIEENRANHSLYSGLQDYALGVESTDQKKIWHIFGRAAFHDYPNLETVILYEIGKTEYDSIMEDLEAARAKENDFVPEEAVPDEGDAKTKIQLLEERLDELMEENQMLIECLLEMSEIVYG